MPLDPPARLTRPGGRTVAYRHRPGRQPGVVFLGGFRSDMTGAKAAALDAWCQDQGRAYLRFDYQGHGESDGRFEDGDIGQWAGDAIAVLDELTEGPRVLVGSSMGGWIMLLAALARPTRVAGLVGVASAPDFTEELIWPALDSDSRARLQQEGVIYSPSAYDEAPEPITWQLIQEGRDHLLLGAPIPLHCPARLLHGMLDADVPWTVSTRLAERLAGDDVRVTLIKDGDHRLSRDQDLELLIATLGGLLDPLEAGLG